MAGGAVRLIETSTAGEHLLGSDRTGELREPTAARPACSTPSAATPPPAFRSGGGSRLAGCRRLRLEGGCKHTRSDQRCESDSSHRLSFERTQNCSRSLSASIFL